MIGLLLFRIGLFQSIFQGYILQSRNLGLLIKLPNQIRKQNKGYITVVRVSQQATSKMNIGGRDQLTDKMIQRSQNPNYPL